VAFFNILIDCHFFTNLTISSIWVFIIPWPKSYWCYCIDYQEEGFNSHYSFPGKERDFCPQTLAYKLIISSYRFQSERIKEVGTKVLYIYLRDNRPSFKSKIARTRQHHMNILPKEKTAHYSFDNLEKLLHQGYRLTPDEQDYYHAFLYDIKPEILSDETYHGILIDKSTKDLKINIA